MPETAHDLSFIGLFFQADPVVKGVMILLAAASVATWTIIFERLIRLMVVRRQARRFELDARNGTARPRKGIPARVFAAGLVAWRDDDPEERRVERRERIERAMRSALSVELRRLQFGLPLLATVGSAGPFVGLFGTVWGIMNSFSAIAASQDTSLSVVAPGIAEALFATALGLVAAIPAVIAYNKFTTDLGRLGQAMQAGIGHVGDALARDRSTAAHAKAAE